MPILYTQIYNIIENKDLLLLKKGKRDEIRIAKMEFCSKENSKISRKYVKMIIKS